MIQTEIVGDRIRTYSDAGMQIRQVETGILYHDAVDVPGKYTYEETDIPIPREAVNIDEDTLENAMRFMMGDGLITTPSEPEPDYFNENEQEPNYFNEEE